MSSEDNDMLAAHGTFMYYEARVMITQLVLWGIYLACTFAAIISLLRQGLKAPASRFLLVVLLGVLALSTFSVVERCHQFLDTVLYTLTRNLDLPLAERLAIASSVGGNAWKATLILNAQGGPLILIGDAVIVWRAWNIWMRSKFWMIFPVFLIVAATVMSLTSSILVLANAEGRIVSNTNNLAIVAITGVSCSIAANAITTFMIGVQAYQHREAIKDAFKSRSSQSLRILQFLTEGGLIYLLLQIVTFTLNLLVTPLSPLDYTWAVMSDITTYASITYPAAVILMVSYNRSLAQDSGITGQLSDIDTHLSFVRTPPAKSNLAPTGSGGRGMGSFSYSTATRNGISGSEKPFDPEIEHGRVPSGN